MDRTNENKEAEDLLRCHLKVLLLHLAAKSENPGYQLQVLIQEVIDELHDEVVDLLSKKPHLKLVSSEE